MNFKNKTITTTSTRKSFSRKEELNTIWFSHDDSFPSTSSIMRYGQEQLVLWTDWSSEHRQTLFQVNYSKQRNHLQARMYKSSIWVYKFSLQLNSFYQFNFFLNRTKLRKSNVLGFKCTGKEIWARFVALFVYLNRFT